MQALITKSPSHWVKVLRSKYKMIDICPESIYRNSCSYVWRSLPKVWNEVRNKIIWSVLNGETIKFWMDNWVPDMGPLWDTRITSHVQESSLRAVRDGPSAAMVWKGILPGSDQQKFFASDFTYWLFANLKNTENEIIRQSLSWAQHFRDSCLVQGLRSNMYSCTQVGWKLPPLGWVKINGSANYKDYTATAAGVIRDDQGSENHGMFSYSCGAMSYL
ncbi:hypothetical protein GOBAR_DD13793 [Gossypium barbadense]|nr:hypothetical protein GOBAR_DD13793 [Gossypium barbadense]